jgi:hypothetical protein
MTKFKTQFLGIPDENEANRKAEEIQEQLKDAPLQTIVTFKLRSNNHVGSYEVEWEKNINVQNVEMLGLAQVMIELGKDLKERLLQDIVSKVAEESAADANIVEVGNSRFDAEELFSKTKH